MTLVKNDQGMRLKDRESEEATHCTVVKRKVAVCGQKSQRSELPAWKPDYLRQPHPTVEREN